MIKIYDIPEGLEEIKAKYGDPGHEAFSREWFNKHIKTFRLPVELRLSWDPGTVVNKILAHEDVGDAMVDAIAEIAWFYRDEFVEKYNFYGGTYAYRKKRGGDEFSTHAWGIAIDFNPHLGRFGSIEDAASYPRPIVQAFKERGFEWGGEWSWPDAMHFQAARGY